MKASMTRALSVFCFLAIPVEAALVTVDTGPLTIRYDDSVISNLGTPQISGTQIIFNPGLYLEAPADQLYYYDALYFSALFTVTANPGYALTGHTLTANGNSYVGDDAMLGISDAFSLTYYGASYYSGALTGMGAWSTVGSIQTSPPEIGFGGSLWISTENHYGYEGIVGYEQEARYEWVYSDNLVGYEPLFDEEGNWIGEQPIYESYAEEVFVGYFDIPIYGYIPQTSGGSVSLDSIVLDLNVQASPVPVPPAAILFASALGLAGGFSRWSRRRD